MLYVLSLVSNNSLSYSKPKSAEQSASEALVDHLVEETNGLKLDLEVAMAAFLNKERKKKAAKAQLRQQSVAAVGSRNDATTMTIAMMTIAMSPPPSARWQA